MQGSLPPDVIYSGSLFVNTFDHRSGYVFCRRSFYLHFNVMMVTYKVKGECL
ncbi:MAG: hypothetical protein K0S33_2804 [Bacteroidetes bacterium]|jgi:hypothetical protein|nr:hypothetical protein [Bacteroidota bacterium]